MHDKSGNDDGTRLVVPDATQREKQPDQSDSNWQPGDVILDLYDIQDVFTTGGMGLVYHAHHRSWKIDLVIKCPRPEIVLQAGGRQSFIKEAETWIELGLHPHIVTCYYVRSIESVPMVFAEYIDGGSLKDWINNGRLYEGGHRQALEQILDIAIQFAWGLSYAHDKGLVHRDVKPANVLITKEGEVKVTDFGLARARFAEIVPIVDSRGLERQASTVLMTPAYCSPEQADCAVLAADGVPFHEWPVLGPATDIWSWGASILEMFTGGVTWQTGLVVPNVLEDYLQDGAEEPHLPPMPDKLADLLRQCFRQSPAERPEDMQGIAGQLQNIYQEHIGQPYPKCLPKAADLLAGSLNNKALSMLDLGHQEQAEAILQQALDLDELHPEATYHLTLLLWRRGAIDDMEALKRLERLLNISQTRWPWAYMLGLVHMERGDYKSALESFKGLEEYAEVQSAAMHAQKNQPGLGLRKTVKEHKVPVYSVAFSPDGRHAISGSDYGPGVENTLLLWDAETGNTLRNFKDHKYMARSVAFSPNGRYVLTGNEGQSMRLWDAVTGREKQLFRKPGSSNNAVMTVAFSPDGRYAISGFSNILQLWDVETGKSLRTYQGHRGYISSAAFSPDGRFALSGSGAGSAVDKALLMLWDVATAKCLRVFEDDCVVVYAVAFSPDGRTVVSASKKNIRLWDVATGECLRTFQDDYGENIHSVAFSPAGRYIAAGSYEEYRRDKTRRFLRLWDVKTGVCLHTFDENETVWSVAFSPDGRLLVSGNIAGAVRLWDIKDPGSFQAPFRFVRPLSSRKAVELVASYTDYIEQARSALQQKNYPAALLAATQARSLPGYEWAGAAMEIWHALYSYCRLAKLRIGWDEKTIGTKQTVASSVAFSPDGRYIIMGNEYGFDQGDIELWDVETGKCLHKLKGHTKTVTAVAFSPDGRFALSGSWDKTLRLWELGTMSCLHTLQGHKAAVTTVAFSPDGRYLLSGDYDKNLLLWDGRTGKCRRSFKGHEEGISSVTFSPDGRFVISGSGRNQGHDYSMRRWDVKTGQCLGILTHKYSVSSVAYSPNGRHVLVGCYDKAVRLCDPETMKCPRILVGHEKFVSAVAFSPDGRYALSGSSPGEIGGLLSEVPCRVRLWDLETGKCIQTLMGHKGGITSVAFSPDSRYAISSGKDGKTYLWKLDWELEANPVTDWDEFARPYLEAFLILHTPLSSGFFKKRSGNPSWTEEDLQELLRKLGHAGFGRIRPESVRRKLKEILASGSALKG